MNLFENFDVTDLTFRKPPANDSLTTFKELQELNNLKLDKDFVVQKDNIIDNFEKINSAAGVNFPKNEINKLQNDSSKVIKDLKNYFNRPRPKELANTLGVSMENVDLKSMKTPSYPSGHSAQSKLIAKVLGDKYPQLKQEYNKEAENISNSRNVGRAHYKSDSKFGQEVGERMYEYLKNNKYAI
tara:strand:+ start:1460 stop:2014 length:555 start_codon:yes stop_codon:yes gene_type:complete